MPRFIACSFLCRCSWQYSAALLLRRHSTAKPNSKPSRTFTIDMVSLKFLQHHKHYYSKKYQYLRNCKKQCFCRENLQIRALRKLWGIILRSPKASQLLPPWHLNALISLLLAFTRHLLTRRIFYLRFGNNYKHTPVFLPGWKPDNNWVWGGNTEKAF